MRPSPHTAAGASQAQRGTALFFATALGVTWALQLPAVLAHYGVIAGGVERYMLPAALGGFGPLLAAVLAVRRERRRSSASSPFAALRIVRVPARWYLVALLGFTAIHVAGTATYKLLGGSGVVQWLYLPEHAQHVAAMLIVPFAEEPGWRGFALPRLQARFGALRASLLLGVLWALWHTMMFVLQGATAFSFALMMANIVAGSVVFSWLYNHTRGSLLLAVIAHAGAHLNNPTHALPENVTPFLVYTAAMGVTAVALVLTDRRVFGVAARQKA